MTTETIRAAVLRCLGEVAPEADLAALRADRPIRDQLDIDSMDFLNFVIGIDRALGVPVPESDYGEFGTVDACVRYLSERVR